MFVGAVIARVTGFEPSDTLVDMWQSTLGMLIGGLIAWIGAGRNKD